VDLVKTAKAISIELEGSILHKKHNTSQHTFYVQIHLRVEFYHKNNSALLCTERHYYWSILRRPVRPIQ